MLCSVYALCMLTTPLPAARCAAAPTSSSPQPGGPAGMAALCGGRPMRAGRAHETRRSPRLRPSAKPQARGSAPLPSSQAAAPLAPGVSSTSSWCGVPLRRPYRRRLPHRRHPRRTRPSHLWQRDRRSSPWFPPSCLLRWPLLPPTWLPLTRPLKRPRLRPISRLSCRASSRHASSSCELRRLGLGLAVSG